MKARSFKFGYGSVIERVTSYGKKRWYVLYRDFSGKWIQRVVKNAQSKKEAVSALKSLVKKSYSEEFCTQERRINFKEFCDIYLSDYAKINKRTWETDIIMLKIMKKFFSTIYLDEISSQHIEQFKAWRMKSGVKNSTINRYLAVLRKMLNLAVEWSYLKREKFPKIKLFSEKDNYRQRILSREEERSLLALVPDYLRSFIIIALNTGMRYGEILGLTWNKIDLKNKIIVLDKTKSDRKRLVPVNKSVFGELIKYKKSHYLFINPRTNKPLQELKTAFKTACRKIGIEDLRFHDLRHTFASRLIEKGVDIITVKEILGHSSVRVTERYTHSSFPQKEFAVKVLEIDR